MMKDVEKILPLLSLATSTLFLGILVAALSCTDELDAPEIGVAEGLPCTVSMQVRLADMEHLTRAAGVSPDSDDARNIDDLWVGIYNAATGERTGCTTVEGLTAQPHVDYPLAVSAKSGRSYIVAVANAAAHYGIMYGEEKGRQPLDELLAAADTWDKYKRIVAVQPDPQSVAQVSDDFLMSGIYRATDASENEADADYTDTEGMPFSSVGLRAGPVTLSGAIHLRRLVAYVRFHLAAAENLTLEPVSWQVVNLPAASYLQERMDCNDTTPPQYTPNAADMEMANLPENYGGATYSRSPVFGAAAFVREPQGSDSSYSFDFYQYENKHRGLAGVSSYADREREHKLPDRRNSGWYASLVRSAGETVPAEPSHDVALMNNNATYVVIKCRVAYYVDAANVRVPAATAGAVRRAGEATYVIHLGFCEHKSSGAPTAETARDFNCRRNTRYTYNVTVNGLDDIRVEAVGGNGDVAAGASGDVTDMITERIELDSHYGVFNIRLTDEQRRNFVWRIRAPFGDGAVDMVGGSGNRAVFTTGNAGIVDVTDESNRNRYEALPDNQFYTWLQFRPAASETSLAPYPGDPRYGGRAAASAAGDPGVWYIEQLRDPDRFPNPSGSEWYTVFVDEYLYEREYDASAAGFTGGKADYALWRNFVNKENRQAWIAPGRMNVSDDGESTYSNSVYLITQKSIQTYYADEAPEAIGIEHENESRNGTSFAWVDYNNKVYATDGRTNLYNFVRTNTARNQWNKILMTDGSGANTPRVYAGKTYALPNHPDEYMTACMARNRDLNGDNVIDENEIRWYLPAAATYTQIVLGALSLPSPLFRFTDYSPDEITAGVGALDSHYAGSDNRMLWGEELAAMSELNPTNWSPTPVYAGALRCIRKLGRDMSSVSGDADIEQAYHHDPATRTIEMDYFRAASLRPAATSFIASHDISSINSFPARKFKYAGQDCNRLNTTNIQGEINLNLNGSLNGYYRASTGTSKYYLDRWENSLASNSVCGRYSEEADGSDRGSWRVPNISELTILHYFGIVTTSHLSCSREYFSSRGQYFLGVTQSEVSAEPDTGNRSVIYLRCVKDVPE